MRHSGLPLATLGSRANNTPCQARCAQNADHLAHNTPFSPFFTGVVCTLSTAPYAARNQHKPPTPYASHAHATPSNTDADQTSQTSNPAQDTLHNTRDSSTASGLAWSSHANPLLRALTSYLARKPPIPRLGEAAHARISGLSCELAGTRARGCTRVSRPAVRRRRSVPTCEVSDPRARC